MLSGHDLTVAEVARLQLALTRARERLTASAPQDVLASLRGEVVLLLDRIGRLQSQTQNRR
jgi:hypothetical protein